MGTSQDRSLVPEYSTGSFERMAGSFEMQERLSGNQLFRGALVRPTLQPFVPEIDRGTTPRSDSKSSPKEREGSEYGMMDDGRSDGSRASSMHSLVEAADSATSLLNLKYDPPPREEIETVQEQGESREDAAMNESTQGVTTGGSSLFRQLSPRMYGNSSGGSPSSPSMYGLPTSISGMLPLTTDDTRRSGTKSLQNGGELRKYLDFSAGILVTLNFFFMCWELQWEGENLGALMGLAGYRPQDLLALRGIEVVFSFLFQIELALRVYADRWDFLFQLANWFDALLVLNSFVEMYIFFAYTLQGHQDYFLEMTFRGIATLRTIRIMRAMRLFRGLRLLLKACHAFLPTLAWSMVLLGVIMSTSGILVGRMLQYFIAEEDEELEDRIWVWNRYGTAYRSIYTLYEITFAGNWPSNVRPILEKVSHFFVLFFVLYITIVVFAAIRVITAVFLKDTLDAAQNDADHQLAESLKKKAQYVTKLEKFFETIDHGGNGMITEAGLNEMLENPRVKAYFETLDLAVHEGTALFHILDNGDGEVTLEEFIDGILRCKGPARAIDQVAMQAELKTMDQKVTALLQWVQEGKVNRRSADKLNMRTEKRKTTLTKDLRAFRLEDSADMKSLGVSKVKSAA